MLSKRVAAERLRLGWTQAHLAERLGVSRSIVALMESGKSAIYVERLLALEPAGFDIAFILWGERAPVTAARFLDWDLLAEIHCAVATWCESRNVVIAPDKQALLLKVLYRHFAARGSIDRAGFEEAMRLAA